MNREKTDTIIGLWKLASLELSDGENTFKPFGEHATGMLTYMENGYMFGILSGENRPKVTSPAMMGIKEEERAAISKNFISYAGPYTVEDNEITHNVQVSFIPNLMDGPPHKSTFYFSHNKLLTVSKPQDINNTKITITLVWERVEQ